jgi:hypothetical protein
MPPGAKITLPNVKTVEFSGGVKFFDIFELSGVESLRFMHTGWQSNRMTGSIPSQLTKLFLGSIRFPPIPPSSNLPQSLPALRTLELQDVVSSGLIQDYLRCPKLVELSCRCSKGNSGRDVLERRRGHYRYPVQRLFDESFFRGVPNLESILLHGLTLGVIPASIPQSCPLLHTMRVEDCEMRKFLLSFANYIRDEKTFPSLRVLRIDDSWPMNLNTSYEQFHEYCRLKRPQLWITGNERIEIAYPPVSSFSNNRP